jgi:hypothetical protein
VCFFCVGVIESRQHGTAVSWRRTQCHECVQDGGVVWRRAGVDGRPGKINALITLEDGFTEDDGGDSAAYTLVCVEVLLDWLCFSPANGLLGQTLSF